MLFFLKTLMGQAALPYSPPPFFSSPHAQSIYPTFFRWIKIAYKRERFETADGDFLEIDWLKQGNKDLVVICHGLEGCSRSHYVLGMARALGADSFDICCPNYRGCGGKPNSLLASYHSGKTDDLLSVLEAIVLRREYRRIFLLGFSVGGNIVLKFLGEYSDYASRHIKAAIAFSVPCDLRGAAIKMASPQNRFYMRRFLTLLYKKLKEKKKLFPTEIDLSNYEKVRTFYDFDSRFTAPWHGYNSAEEYWQKNSSREFLSNIRVSTLVVNAEDDTFLSPECYPLELAKNSPYLQLEVPRHGGHCGFVSFNRSGTYWSELRARTFFRCFE